MSAPRPATDRFLRWLARLSLQIFYRRIEVVGLERFPMSQPVIVLANHTNSLVDAVAITGFLPRMPRFLGASIVWDYRLLRPVLNAAGVVPLYRQQDGRAHQGSLTESLATASDLLAAGGVLAIFPEGISHNSPRILPLKTGAARVALETETRHGPVGVALLPVCLTFEAKYKPRSRALIEIGDPVPLPAEEVAAFGSDNRSIRAEAVRSLTRRLQDRLTAMTPGHESWEEARLVARAAEMIANTAPGSPPPGDLSSLTEQRRSIQQGYLWVRSTQPERTDALRQHVAEYDRALRRLGLNDAQVAHGRAAEGAEGGQTMRDVLQAVLLAPVALVGVALNFLPFWGLRLLSRRKDLDKRSTWSIFAGAIAFPLFWSAAALVIGLYVGTHWGALPGWLCAIATIPIAVATGHLTLSFLDSCSRLWTKIRARLLLRSGSSRGGSLVAQRQRIQRELSSIAEDYAAARDQSRT